MSSSEAVTRPYSDSAFSKGTVVHGARPDTPTPSVSTVEPTTQGNVGGTDLAPHRAGIFATLRDATGEVVLNRDPKDTDVVEVELDSGRAATMTLRQAKFAGFAYQDEHGRWAETDRAAIRQTEAELHRVQRAQRDAQSVHYSDAVETGVDALATAMANEAGLSFDDGLATLMGGGDLPTPYIQWASNRGVDIVGQYQNYLNTMRAHVINNILLPKGINPESFYSWVRGSGLTRAQHIKAAMGMHHLRDDSAYKYLATQFLSVGGNYR